jgi:hypothetical protein
MGWSLTGASVAISSPTGTGAYSAAVTAITFEQATNLALAVTAGLVVAAVLVLWFVKSVAQKILVAVLLGLLAFAVWSQRTALEDCADKVEANLDVDGASVSLADTECTFFGVDVTVSDPRGE